MPLTVLPFRAVLLSLGLSLAASAQAQDTPASEPVPRPLSSRVDFTVPGARDLPVTCRPGDEQPFQGKTMGEVFGAAWPVQPVPVDAKSHSRPKVLGLGKLTPPRGLEGQHAEVVMAILVGADGNALAAEPVCVSAGPFALAAKRALRGARFDAATINGQPVTSVVTAAIVFRPGRGAESTARSAPGEQD